MDRMSPQDASFLHVEDWRSHMHIGSIGLFEGPPPPFDDIRAMVEAKLHLVPRYRQKVRFVPFEVGRPVWTDDTHFNLDYHLRHTSIPAPGSDDQLRNLVGRLMSQKLDRAKPLWEMWVVEGLEDDRWAIVSKTHHCMVDGVSGTDLLTVVLDHEREPIRLPAPEFLPDHEPTSARLLLTALADRAVSPYEQLRTARAAFRQVRDVVQGATSMVGLVRPTPRSSLNGSFGPHRRWSWAGSSLADVKVVRTGLGGTVNDVVLSAITTGFRELLLSRGESVEGRVVRTLVPVSVRSPGERGTYNNRVSALVAALPVGIDDPTERLTAIRAQMDGLKESKAAVAGEVLVSLSGFAPPMLLALGARAISRVPQRNVNTVTTNVPGPQFPLYAAGREMLEARPFVPIANAVRIGVAIFSYNGRLSFGVTGDYDTAPDIDVLCRGIEDGMAELVKLAGGRSNGRAGAPAGAARRRGPDA